VKSNWETELRLGRRALAEGLVDGPTLTKLLLVASARPDRPLAELLARDGEADPGRVEQLAADLGPPPPPPKPEKVRVDVMGVRCGLKLDAGPAWTRYVGHRPSDPQPVAVLVIDTDALRQGLWVDFLETVRASKDVRGPNLFDVLEVGRADEGFVIVTRFFPGTITLEALLGRVHRLKLSEALRIGREVARGLKDLHAAGLAHRDLTPANVLLTRDGKVFVRDAGIVFQPAEAREAGERVYGTPHYMAPETLKGNAGNPLSDVYALGVIAYEMAAGARPFEGERYADLKRQHLEDAPVRPDAVLGDLPGDVGDLVTWLLAKDSKERPHAEKLVNVIQTLERSIVRSGSTERLEGLGRG